MEKEFKKVFNDLYKRRYALKSELDGLFECATEGIPMSDENPTHKEFAAIINNIKEILDQANTNYVNEEYMEKYHNSLLEKHAYTGIAALYIYNAYMRDVRKKINPFALELREMLHQLIYFVTEEVTSTRELCLDNLLLMPLYTTEKEVKLVTKNYEKAKEFAEERTRTVKEANTDVTRKSKFVVDYHFMVD